ncbi:MAG: hypothetical protein AAF645_18945 [Myxococcota bacterium]
MTRAREARLAHGRGECAEAVVLRAFMEHVEWLAPAWVFGKRAGGRKVCFDGQHVVPEGELWVFTEAATATHASQSGTRLGTYVAGIPGIELFGALKERAKALRINPGGYAEDELHLAPESYETLGEWASGVAVERVIPYGEGGLSAAAIERLRAHHHFHLPLFEDGRMISKAGHGGFEQPGVVCVTPDAYDNFEAAIGDELRAQLTRQVIGADALALHLRKQKIDAVYFNPMGPAGSVVLPIAAFEGLTAVAAE